MQDVILHCEELRQDKARQAQEMDMAKLDLEDAVNSRRELQKRLDQCLKELQRVTDSHEYSKVSQSNTPQTPWLRPYTDTPCSGAEP